MTKPTYTLSWILPFVRQALKGTSNLEYRTFLPAVWSVLERDHVAGVVRNQQHQMIYGVYQYDEAPSDLRNVTAEAFFYLLRNGYIAPQAPDRSLNTPSLQSKYNVTQRGFEWFNGNEPYPEEAEGYMRHLRERVSNLDSIIEQYITEALTAYERQAFFAAAVMLGAASEKAIYLLAESMLEAFIDEHKKTKLHTVLGRRKLEGLLNLVRDSIQAAFQAKTLAYPQFESSVSHLTSLYEAIRVQRNDAVHPMNATVSQESVRFLIHSFPYALAKTEELRVWFTDHPNSI